MMVFTMVMTYIVTKAVSLFMDVRVTEEGKRFGLDATQHREKAFHVRHIAPLTNLFAEKIPKSADSLRIIKLTEYRLDLSFIIKFNIFTESKKWIMNWMP
jgi:hypothetical protein